MANEKRLDLIDRNKLKSEFEWLKSVVNESSKYEIQEHIQRIEDAPAVDAVPVDEIRVDIMSLSLENQEAVLNVSICGKQNEVKIPFSKDVAEVVHGRWLFDSNTERYFCSACNEQALCTSKDIPEYDYDWEENLRYSHTETIIEEHLTNCCPNCGARMMGGDGNA